MDITFGSANKFEAASSVWTQVAMLDATHFVVAYRDVGDSSYGKAIIGLVSGTTISSYGTPVTFNTALTERISVAMLDATHFVVSFQDGGDSSHGKAVVGEISGTTISSYGSINEFNAAATNETWIAALDATHFVIAFQDGGDSNHGKAIVGLVSGTTISSYGSANKFNAASSDQMSVAALDATHFVVSYRDYGHTEYGEAVVGLVSGTTISSYGAINAFTGSSTSWTSVHALDATHFVVGYQLAATLYGTAIVGLVSGTTISSYGTPSVFQESDTRRISVYALSASAFAVAYRDNGESDYGKAVIGTVSGTTISSYGTVVTFAAAFTDYVGCAALDATNIVISYRDGGDSDHGKAIVGAVSSVFGGKVIDVATPAKVNGVSLPKKVIGVE